MTPNDYDEDWLLHEQQDSWGNGHCYDGSPPVRTGEPDYNARYTLWDIQAVPEPVTVDLNWQALKQEATSGFNEPEDLATWVTRPVGSVETVAFDFEPHKTSNTNSRDTLYFGALEASGQSLPVWGFETWQEFRSHLSPQDREHAREVRDQIVELTYQHTGLIHRHWIAKRDGQTAAGFWAITAEYYNAKERMIWVYANGEDILLKRKRSRRNEVRVAHELARRI
jgi:hypothetical protein